MGDQRTFIIRVVVLTLAAVLVSMLLVMLYGLFDVRVDNGEIFKIIGPAFNTIVGVFVGILGGRLLGKEPDG